VVLPRSTTHRWVPTGGEPLRVYVIEANSHITPRPPLSVEADKPPDRHDPKDPGETDHRAGTPPCPSTEIASPTRQLTISDASSHQPKRRC
jgi:hypothetical protein